MALEYANEVWKDCKGYEGIYQVSNYGRVWSVRSQKYLYGSKDKDGYLRVNLTAKNGKIKLERIHRLVAIAFLENPFNYPQVNHKDENKSNNRVDNLEWCNAEYNNTYSKGKKVYCIELQKEYSCSQGAMRDLGVDGSDIRKCCKGQKKSAGSYHWRYAD